MIEGSRLEQWFVFPFGGLRWDSQRAVIQISSRDAANYMYLLAVYYSRLT